MTYESFNDLPKTSDTKNKVKKTFSLTTEAANTYELAKLKGVDSTKIVQEKIEQVLKEIKELLK